MFLHSFLILNEQNSKSAEFPDDKLKQNEKILKNWQLVSTSLKINELQEILNTGLDETRPEFICLNSWLNLKRIELAEPASFRHLTASLRDDAVKWREYFWPRNMLNEDIMEKDVDLLNDLPYRNKLDVVQKLALWFSIRPEKVFNFTFQLIMHKLC